MSAEPPTPPDPTAYGQPISAERQAELQAILDAWNAPGADHGERRGPFDRAGLNAFQRKRLRLNGADVAWLAEESRRHAQGWVRNLGVEVADLNASHQEREYGGWAELEHAHLSLPQLERADLGEVHLEGADLNDAHLERARLSIARLEGADLFAAHLEGAELFGAHLEGTDLRRGWMDSKTVLSEAMLDDTTQLGDIQWSGVGAVNLTRLNWEVVRRLGDEAALQRSAGSYDAAAVVRAYRQVAAQLRAQGMVEVADRFSERAQIVQRRVLRQRMLAAWRRPWRLPGAIGRFLGSAFLAVMAGYGYRPFRTILLYLAFITLFAAGYFAYGSGCAIASPLDVATIAAQNIGQSHVCAGDPMSWHDAFVVSFTAFHGRGFFVNTFKPSDPQATLAAAEAVLGLLIEISFIATFTQRFFSSK